MIWILMGILKTELIILSSATDDPNLSKYTGDITEHLYVALSNDTKVYKLSNVQDMMNDTRRGFIFNFNYIFHGSGMRQRSLICYLTSLTYRSAVYDLQRYFAIRDLYVNNLEYEIGYLTQEVIHHYQALLEIYQIVHKKYVENSERNFAPVNYVFFMYTNILEKSKVIIHLCNMMHELEEKYKKTKSNAIFDETDFGFEKSNKHQSRLNLSDVDRERMAYQNYLKQKQKNELKIQKERKNYQKKLKKFGQTTTRRKRIKKKGTWPIDYGWSIENW